MENKLFFEKVTRVFDRNLYELKKPGKYSEILAPVGHSKMFKNYTEAWKFYNENKEVIDDLVKDGNKVHLPYYDKNNQGIIFCFCFNKKPRQHDKLLNDDVFWQVGLGNRNFFIFSNLN